MLAILVVFVLVSGYIYSHRHLPSRYKMAKSDGWDLYFQVAKRGTEIAIISAAICFIIDMTDIIGILLKQCFGLMYNIDFKQLPVSHHQFKLLSGGVFTIFLSYVIAFFRSRKYDVAKNNLVLIREVVEDNPLEYFIIDATLTFVDGDQDSRVVCITLSSGKVYIGFCVGGNNVTHGNLEHIKIIPIRSGYRDKDNQELKVKNNYEEYFLEQDDVDISDFVIIIPTSEIISYQNFDLPAYEAIQPSNSEDSSDNLIGQPLVVRAENYSWIARHIWLFLNSVSIYEYFQLIYII